MYNSLDILSFNNIIIVIILFFSYLLYNYYYLLVDKKISKRNFYKLFYLRFFFLLIITIFLINPIFTKKEITMKNIPVFIDNSLSMKMNLENINFNIENLYTKLSDWSNKNNFKIDYYIFGEKFKNISNHKEIEFNHKRTNYKDLFNNINSEIILITDGLVNSGPIKVPDLNYSINILGIGDESDSFNDIELELVDFQFINDSINVDFSINSNFKNDLYRQNIYLSNSKNKKNIIGEFDYNKNYPQSTKSITLNRNLFSSNNIIHLDKYLNELDYNNNSILININEEDILDKSILFLSGSLSQNTKFIKNNILSELTGYKTTHYYRLYDDIWNDSLDLIDFTNYDIVILDDFPMNFSDNKFINKIIDRNFENIIYFISSPFNENSNLLIDDCKCTYKNSNKNDIVKSKAIKYNNKEYYISPTIDGLPINCEKSIFSYYNNTLIANNNNISIFFVSNLNQIQSIEYNYENNFINLLNDYLEDILYNDNKYIDLYTSYISFMENESIDVYFKLNHNFNDHVKYIDIFDSKNDFVDRIYNSIPIDDDLHLFKISLIEKGKYILKGFINSNDNLFNSNSLTIDIYDNNLELSEIYLDDKLLEYISRKSNGIYYKYDKLDAFLEEIQFETSERVITDKSNIIRYTYLLFILILLIALDWYYRNKVGLA
mgnify:CR=1 FL=1